MAKIFVLVTVFIGIGCGTSQKFILTKSNLEEETLEAVKYILESDRFNRADSTCICNKFVVHKGGVGYDFTPLFVAHREKKGFKSDLKSIKSSIKNTLKIDCDYASYIPASYFSPLIQSTVKSDHFYIQYFSRHFDEDHNYLLFLKRNKSGFELIEILKMSITY